MFRAFGIGEGPMTVCMVIEFSNLYQRYWTETWYQTLTASYGFLETLKPEDFVAVVAYDLRPEILSDFSTNKQKAYEAMQRLRIPAFSESNLFDALVDTAERMNEIEGRKAIVLLSTGVDTFSKLTFDKTRKALQNAGVPIYGIGLMQTYRELAGCLRLHGTDRAPRFSAGGQSDADLREGNRRYVLLPAILWRISEYLPEYLGFAPESVHDDVQPDQPDSRRKVPEDQSRIGESGYRRTAPCRGPEGQADQIHDHREAGLHGASRSRIALTQKA